MSKMIQVRNVPDDLHRALKARAAEEGLSLSDYLLREAQRAVERPTVKALAERIRSREKVRASIDSAKEVRKARESGR